MNSRIKAFCLSFLLLCMLALTLCACKEMAMEKNPSEQSETLDTDDLIVVGFSQLGSESLWRSANSASIQESLSRYDGYFVVFNNARQKKENQIKAIRQFISQRVDYIIFAPMDEDGWDTVLQEAKNAGIPVILVDRRVNSDLKLYTAWVGSDMKKEGQKAGEWLAEYEKQKGLSNEEIRIVVLTGTEGATATIGRTEGFHEVAQKHPNWVILEETCGDFTTAKGEEVMTELLEKYSRIDVVISQNDDMTFGAIEAIEKKGLTTGIDGDIAIVSFDAVKEALELVAEGKINVDIECNPMDGDYVKEIIQNMEMGMSVHKNYWVKEDVFTIDNVNEEVLSQRMY